MSSSRKAMSGLGSLRRDWSDSSMAKPTQSSQEIPWEKSPTRKPAAPLTGSQKRLQAIQAALVNVQHNTPPEPLRNSEAANRGTKRASPNGSDGSAAKKKRRLPPGWAQPAPTSGFGSNSIAASSSSSSRATNQIPQPAPPSSNAAIFGSTDKVASVFLSAEQAKILKLVKEGKSLFYTGSAGTGKSVLLREIIKTLRKKYARSPDAVAVTASTGIAACNIGGTTLHSFAGAGLLVGSNDENRKKVLRNKKSTDRWRLCKALIIDEISMVDGGMFDKLAALAKNVRNNKQPFGGIQVIVTGDFFQLPPVSKGTGPTFAFEAQEWETVVQHTYNLTQVFRQKDQNFIDMLNEMRFGKLSQKSIAHFRRLSRPLQFDDGVEPTELFPTRNQVDRSNVARMRNLQTDTEVYIASDTGTASDDVKAKHFDNMMAAGRLELRVGAQVMLIKNVDDTLVNGSLGKIIRFVDPNHFATQLDKNGDGGTGVIGGTKPGSKAAAGPVKRYPMVEFVLPNGQHREVLVTADSWKVEEPGGGILASRSQLPLILAWAMSIHKSQGQTLDRVRVDLGKIFEKGQAYVALSRATTLDGLQILGFDPAKVQAHPKVIEWSKKLTTIETD